MQRAIAIQTFANGTTVTYSSGNQKFQKSGAAMVSVTTCGSMDMTFWKASMEPFAEGKGPAPIYAPVLACLSVRMLHVCMSGLLF